LKNGANNSGRSWLGGVEESEAAGEAARAAYYDTLGRTCDASRTLLDEFGETLRRSRGVAPIDRRPTDREVALQLRLMVATFAEVADAFDPPAPRDPDEITTTTKRIKRRGDSQPGQK